MQAGNDIVVPQPTCSYVLKKDYADYVGGPDAELVAANTYDAAEYLMKVHKADGTQLDTDFTRRRSGRDHVPRACHLRAQNIGFKSRDLMKLTGAKVRLVQQCSGIDGMWGLRAENADVAIPIGQKLGDEIERGRRRHRHGRLPPRQHGDRRADRPGAVASAPGAGACLRHPDRGPGARRSTAGRRSHRLAILSHDFPKKALVKPPIGSYDARCLGCHSGQPPWGRSVGKGDRLAGAGGVQGARTPGSSTPRPMTRPTSAKHICAGCGVRSACLEHALHGGEGRACGAAPPAGASSDHPPAPANRLILPTFWR